MHADPTQPDAAETPTNFEYLGTNLPADTSQSLSIPRITQDYAVVQEATVRGMFQELKDLIQHPAVDIRSERGSVLNFYVEFDPVMGYLRSIKSIGSIERDSDYYETSIESLKIIK